MKAKDRKSKVGNNIESVLGTGDLMTTNISNLLRTGICDPSNAAIDSGKRKKCINKRIQRITNAFKWRQVMWSVFD
jgi:hypothetical protein